MRNWPVTLFFLLCVLNISAQQVTISGQVRSTAGEEISAVSVQLSNSKQGAITDINGKFSIRVQQGETILLFRHIQYQPITVELELLADTSLQVQMLEKTTQLQDIKIESQSIYEDEVVSFQKVDSKSAKSLPSTFGDFNKILVTLPGVSSNNELSSAYSVRGGNFDENLVYVNDIPVYRPFLSNAGRQEGLSFVNPDMVQDIEFYAGGWEPKYGDKLSSSLNIEYKEPDSLEASITAGLLGGTAYIGGNHKKMSYLVGVRHRDSRYLLNTLETEGQYFPLYTDIQSLLTFDLSGRKSEYINKTKLNVLLSVGRNRYLTEPASQTTEFGSVQRSYRLFTAFEGREILNYNTYQVGTRLTHRFNNRARAHLISSSMLTNERELYEVEGAYRLCDVNNNPNESTFDQCVVDRGVGTNYDYGRNSLVANINTIENRWEYMLNLNHVLEAGAGFTTQHIDDQINEYSFVDSSDYVTDLHRVKSANEINSVQYFGYFQSTYLWKDSVHALSSGVRFSYWDYNNQILVSPRISYRLAPKWKKSTTFKFSAGLYQQPPFYRELRDFDGDIYKDVFAQKSLHLIASMTRVFHLWKRPFLFSSEVYHKQMWDLIPYDIDNVKLRYYPTVSATGYARGIDFRVHGEFVKGTQSWFSVGFLQTREDLAGDSFTMYLDSLGNEVFPDFYNQDQVKSSRVEEVGYVRRPMDQRINIAAYFEDHMPNDPTLRVNLNLVFGSGYPFGPPKNQRYRNYFAGDEYYRVDIGLSKFFNTKRTSFSKLWLRVEVLNALAADNTLSYSWIQDVNGAQFAIPNSLSARFFNVKLTAEL